MSKRPKLSQFKGEIASISPDLLNRPSDKKKPSIPVKRKRNLGDVLSSLVDNNNKALTPSQVDALLGMEYPNGDSYFSVDSVIDSQTLIEFGYILKKTAYREALGILLEIKGEFPDDIVWDNPKTKKSIQEIMDNQELEIKIETVEGLGECKQCKSTSLIHKQFQGRSGDEALLSYYECANCQAKKGNLIIYKKIAKT